MRNIICLILLGIGLNSCQQVNDQNKKIKNTFSTKETKNKRADRDSVVIKKIFYEKSKALKKEITVKNNKKNGIAKEYYPDGKLRTVVNYVDNLKEGKTIWYHKNGKAYRVTPYKKGKMHGIRKTYYQNGKIQAKIPYKEGELQEGTVEYDEKGNIIKHKPEIIFKTQDLGQHSGNYVLQLSLSKEYSKVQFFEERTALNGEKMRVRINTRFGVGTLNFYVSRDESKKEDVKIYAKFNTRLHTPVLIYANYKFASTNK
ncbi:MAG: hypothetical protein MI739_02225 [Bacteroidales bacterium]|nr:hypothetical protein [Bacteroidales bacterium]